MPDCRSCNLCFAGGDEEAALERWERAYRLGLKYAGLECKP